MKLKFIVLSLLSIAVTSFATENCHINIKGNLNSDQQQKIAKKLKLKGYKLTQNDSAAEYTLRATINTTVDYTNVLGNLYGVTKIAVALKNNNTNMVELSVNKEVLRSLFTQSINDKAFWEISKTLNKLNYCY